jgi:hypothetical protein
MKKASKRKSKRGSRRHRGGSARCSEIPLVKYVLNNQGKNCYKLGETNTIDEYMDAYNPARARYIGEFIKLNKVLWELRDDMKSNPDLFRYVDKVETKTDSKTLRTKLIQLIDETVSVDELRRLRMFYFDKLPVVDSVVMEHYKRKLEKLDSMSRGALLYLPKQ